MIRQLRRRVISMACALVLATSGVPALAWADAGSLATGATKLEAAQGQAQEPQAESQDLAPQAQEPQAQEPQAERQDLVPTVAEAQPQDSALAAKEVAPQQDLAPAAKTKAWTGKVDTSWYKAANTSFTLSTPEQVAGLAAIVNGTVKGIAADTFFGKTVTLGADLQLNAKGGKTVWTAIGDVNIGVEHATSTTVYFDGIFDGAGHVVEGLYMPSATENYGGYHAFFGSLGPHAEVRELGIASGEVSGRVAAGIAAVSRVENLDEVPQIVGCFNKASIFGNGSTSRGCAGIFAGENQNGSEGVGVGYRAAACIVDCYNLGRVSGSGPTGGIAGTGSIRMYGCYNAGPVSSTTGGTMHGSLMCDLFAPGSVTASRLVGNGEIENSYGYIGTDERLCRILDAEHTTSDPAYPSEDFSSPYYNETAAFLDADQMDNGSEFLGASYVNDDAAAPINGNMPLLWWQVGKSKVDIALASIDPIGNRRYTGSPVKPALIVRMTDPDTNEPIVLNAGSDYRVVYSDNTAIGRATVTVYGVGRYTGSAAPASFDIVRIDLSSCTIDPIAPQWYYGGEVRPAVSVRTTDDTVLTPDEDYVATYANNDRAGKATVTVTSVGTGAVGSLTADFYLVAAADHLNGSGTEADPYRLSTKGDLQFLSRMVNTDQEAYIGASYRVLNDIDAGAANDNDLGIDPIGLNHHPFAGTFDGAGHAITLNMDAAKISDHLSFSPLIYDYLGLFSCTGSADTTTIKNLTLKGKVVSNGTAAGFIGSAVDAQLVMSNCVNEAEIESAGGAGTAAAGFIGVAAGTRLSMTDCVNRGDVIAGGNASGLVVYLNGGTGEHRFFHCGNEGIVTAPESAGGVIQHYAPSRHSSFVAENCYNTGDVVSYRADGGAAGGILGMDQSSSANAVIDRTCTFIACCNTGTVSGGRHGGGIAGQIYTTPMEFKGCYSTGRVEDNSGLFGAGGICGAVAYKSDGWTFANCYSTGALTGVEPGAILGWAYAGSQVEIRNCFYEESLESGCDKAGVGSYNIAKGVQEPVVVETDATALSTNAMKATGAAGMLARLGSIYEADRSGQVNGGLPICYWQVPVSKVSLTAVSFDPLRTGVAYTGSGITQQIAGSYAGKALFEGVDFLAEYSDNVNPGTASVTLIGIGRFEGTLTRTFTIVNGTLADCVVADVAPQWATDAGARPALVVTNPAGNALELGIDYEVEYFDNKTDGVARALLSGIGNYAGEGSTKEVTFDVVSAEAPKSGAGTQADPYVIASAAQFAFMMAKVNAGDVDYQFASYKLGSDIDLRSTSAALTGKPAIEPVGTAAHSFFGVFDGAGHAITMAVDAKRPYVGLFGVVRGATFKNVVTRGEVRQTVERAESGAETLGCVGALVGYAFDSLHVEGCVNEAAVSSNGSAVAGLVGIADAQGCTVDLIGCTNAGSVESDDYLAAGLLSDMRAAQLTVRDCSNTGSVTASNLAAGLLGRMGGSVQETTKATVSRSFNAGTVKGDYRCGGLVGCMYAYSNVALRTVFNTGALASEQMSGRAAYMTAGANGGLIGGVGGEGVLTIEHAYNVGTLTSSDSSLGLGGLVGYVYASAKSVSIADAYYAGAEKSVGSQKLASGFVDNSAAVQANKMRAAGFPAKLGDGFAADTKDANKGFPVFVADKAVSDSVVGEWSGTGRLRVSPVVAHVYTGEPVVPAVSVYDTVSGRVLDRETDYRVVCENNVHVGRAHARIEGVAGVGKAEVDFAILPASLVDCTLAPIAVQPLVASAAKPALSIVNAHGVALVGGHDYKASYSNNKKVGTAKVVARGVGDYRGSIGSSFKIVKRVSLAKKATVSKIAAQMKTGKALKPAIRVKVGKKKLVYGSDYKVSYSNNKKAGKAKVTVKGIGLYTGTVKATFTILESDLAKAKVASIQSRIYSGKAICPQPVVKLGGKRLVLGRDYSLAYRNNVNAGVAKVVVKGEGRYRGTKTVKFKILPAKASLALASVTQSAVRIAAADEPAYLSVYTQIGEDASTRTLAHAFSRDELEAMAQGGADNWRAALYWSHGDGSAQDVKVAVTSSFVELEDLFAAAGVLGDYTAASGVKVLDPSGFGPAATPTKATLDECSWFYPAVTPGQFSADGGSQFKPVFALTQISDTIPAGETAGQVASSLAAPERQTGPGKRFIWGVSPAQLASGTGAAGNRLYYNVSSIVIVKPAPAAPAKVNIAKAKFSKVKAQKYNKGKAIKPALTVKYAGKKLKLGRDYKLSYKNNKKRGTAKIVVKGIGSFKGSKTITFKIK